MKRLGTLFIVGLFCAQGPVFAQSHVLTREGNIPSVAVSADPQPNTPEWQLTLEVIKTKAGVLMEKNNQLTQQHDGLVEQYQQAQVANRDIQLKNEDLRQLLKQRHGRTEQQTHIDELGGQIKIKENDLTVLQKQLASVQGEIAEADRKMHLKKLKADLEAQQASKKSSPVATSGMDNDDELGQFKEKVQYEKDQEELLIAQIREARQGAREQGSFDHVDSSEIKLLEDKAADLRQKKEDLQKQVNVDNSQVKTQRYLALTAKKMDLEAKIKEFEDQLVALKDPQSLGLGEPKEKKQMVHQLVSIDTRNSQVRQKISGIHENVTLLREQVSRLERRASKQGISENIKEEK